MPLGFSTAFGLFFGFDFLAEFLFFGVSASAFFGFVIDFFDRDRFVVAFVVLAFIRFVVLLFRFVVFSGDKRERRRIGREARSVRRSGRGEQHQRGEQEDQQVREFPHCPFIGAGGELT
jgi:hypothetical protein